MYIFNTTGAGRRWSQTQLLIAADMATGDLFGYALSLAGETLVVAATGRNNSTGIAVAIPQSLLLSLMTMTVTVDRRGVHLSIISGIMEQGRRAGSLRRGAR